MKISNERRISEIKELQAKVRCEPGTDAYSRDIRLAILQEQIDLLQLLEGQIISVNMLMDILRAKKSETVNRQIRLL